MEKWKFWKKSDQKKSLESSEDYSDEKKKLLEEYDKREKAQKQEFSSDNIKEKTDSDLMYGIYNYLTDEKQYSKEYALLAIKTWIVIPFKLSYLAFNSLVTSVMGGIDNFIDIIIKDK